MIWADVTQSAISGVDCRNDFFVFVHGELCRRFFLIYVVIGDGLGVFWCCVGLVCAWLPYISMLGYANYNARVGVLFNFWVLGFCRKR